MHRLLLALGLYLLLPATGLAQEHPCDVTPPTTYQVRRADLVRVAFCHDQREDDNATPIPIGQLHGYIVNDDTGAVVRDLGLVSPAPGTGPSASGSYYFESGPFTISADIRLNVAVDYNGVRALAATPIVVDVRGGPKAPTGVRVVISQ